MSIKKTTILYILFIVILISKAMLHYWENIPIFNSVHLVAVDGQNKEIKLDVKEKSYVLKLEFYNYLDQDITLNLDPTIKWDISVKGEKTVYKTNVNSIVIPLRSYDWGKVDISIEKSIPFRHILNFIFYAGIIALLYMGFFAQVKTILISFGFVLIVIFLHVYGNWTYIYEAVDFDHISSEYSKSQYVMGQGSPVIIGDEQVYILAAYQYIKSGDPVSINFEHPPLGKYMYGVGLLLTNRPRLISLFLYGVVIVLFYFLAKKYLKNPNLVAPALLLFVSNTLFLDLTKTVMLDLPLLLFILLSALFYLNGIKKKNLRWFVLFALSLGAMAATKFYLSALLFTLACTIDIVLHHKNLFKKYLFSLLLAPLIYIASYIGYFEKHTFMEFIKFQWWLLHWYFGKKDISGFGGDFPCDFVWSNKDMVGFGIQKGNSFFAMESWVDN